MKKTLLCIPSRSMLYAATSFSMYMMGVHSMSKGKFIHPYNPQCSPAEMNRNLGINYMMGLDKARSGEFDEILYIDSDQTFPQDTYFRLAAHKKEIVGVNCSRRIKPFKPVMTKDLLGRPLNHKKKPLVKMEKIGFAATLIQREVFDAIPNFVFYRQVLSRTQWIGEDYIFCDAARKAGFHVYCDLVLSQEIGHIGEETHFLGDK